MAGKFLKQDVKRAFINKGFWIAAVLLLVIFFRAIKINTNFEMDVSTYEIMANAMALSGFIPFAVIFPTLGYSVSFCEEYHSGYLKMILSRLSWKKYGIIRILSVGLTGGMGMSGVFAAVCLFAYIFGVHGMPKNGMYTGTCVQYYLEQYGDFYVLTGTVLLGFLFGVLWALVALAFAVWFCNRYVALIAPFVLYEVMWQMLYKIPVLNPAFLIRGYDINSFPISGIMECIYICITIIITWLGLKRRVHNE